MGNFYKFINLSHKREKRAYTFFPFLPTDKERLKSAL